jgi:CheY-like chemotaxis protein
VTTERGGLVADEFKTGAVRAEEIDMLANRRATELLILIGAILSAIKILIVEDEAISAMALRYTVERIGCSVVAVVDTGEAAIREAEKQRPDLVLMDTRLRTEMTGVEAANRIWEKLGIRSVFVSAYNASELEKDYRGASPLILLVKPVMDGELERLIANLFDGLRRPQQP